MTYSKIRPSLRIRAAQLIWKIRFAITPLAKRALDISVSLMTLILVSPLLILVALFIKLESKGDALFKQERIGLNGVPFTMFKFRSMSSDAQSQRATLELQNEMSHGVIFKMKHDPRVTRVGALIRKTSIDEPFKQQVKLDIQYIEKQNIWFDLLVLLKTIPAVLKARGAY